jgi:hypothetical protein
LAAKFLSKHLIGWQRRALTNRNIGGKLWEIGLLLGKSMIFSLENNFHKALKIKITFRV